MFFKRLRKHRRGIEVTINFVVMIILAIAVLSASFVLIKKFFGSAEKLRASIDSQTELQIRSMLIGGAKVAIPINKVTATHGDFVTFGVGVLNVLKAGGADDDFTIIANDCEWKTEKIPPFNPKQTVSVMKNEQNIFLVAYKIENNVSIGTYICDINVCLYGTTAGSCTKDYAEAIYKAYIIVE